MDLGTKPRLIVVAAVFAFVVVFVHGCADETSKGPTAKQAAVTEATVTGSNICLGCSLKKQKGAAAQCSIFGHKHGLKITKAVGPDGKDLPEMRGWVLHYLETEHSQDLITEHRGETLIITGKVYPLERMLEVQVYRQDVSNP